MKILDTLWKNKRYFLIVVFVVTISLILNNVSATGPLRWNRKQIKRLQSKKQATFTFAVLGDNRDGDNTFKYMLKSIDKHNYVFALDNGDLVNSGLNSQYLNFYNMIKNERTPFLVSVGNHDVQNNGATHYKRIFGRPYYSFSYSKSLFVVLDDSDQQGLGTVQAKWAEKELKKHFTHKFVFLHVPPFDPRPGNDHSMKDPAKAKQFMALMRKYRVDVVFASHIHGYFNSRKSGVKYIISGGAGAELIPDYPNNSFHNYVQVNVTGSRVKTEVKKIP